MCVHVRAVTIDQEFHDHEVSFLGRVVQRRSPGPVGHARFRAAFQQSQRHPVGIDGIALRDDGLLGVSFVASLVKVFDRRQHRCRGIILPTDEQEVERVGLGERR